MVKFTLAIIFLLLSTTLLAQQPYPYPLTYLPLQIEGQTVKMAYMDVPPIHGNGKTVLLFHGKNFNGYYWKDVAALLSGMGYRVIIPDQVGWGKSDKPAIHYSFHMLAANNKALLDTLHIKSVLIIGHSMGGMLAARFALMYPDMVSRLLLEDPIGLEDYRTFLPYTSIDQQYAQEQKATYESYKQYMQGYFPEWKPEYDELVRQQAALLKEPLWQQTALANALTYDMIYQQPVCYELDRIKAPSLLIIGDKDRTIVGKDKIAKNVAAIHGQYPQLAQRAHTQIKNSQLVVIAGVEAIYHMCRI